MTRMERWYAWSLERQAARAAAKPQPIAVIEQRRPTLTRAVVGTALLGPVGTLLSFTWRKKERVKIYDR